MKRSTLIALAAVALLAIVLAVVVDRADAPSVQVTGEEPLVPGLKAAVNDIESIAITASGEDGRFTVARTDAGWTVPDRADFPADLGRVRELLIGLAEARVMETKTSNPELYPRLGVEDVTADSGEGVRVVLTGPVTADVIIGNPAATAGQGTYVRRAGEARSLLVSGELSPARRLDEWLDRDIVDISADQVAAVTVTHPDGEVLSLAAGEGGGMQIGDIPDGRSLTSPSAADPVGRALTGLRFDDVRPADEAPAPETTTVARYTLADGRVLTARLWSGSDDERYLRLAVAVGEETPAGEPADVERESARHAAWTYTIPAYKFDMMAKRMDDLLRPLPPGE